MTITYCFYFVNFLLTLGINTAIFMLMLNILLVVCMCENSFFSVIAIDSSIFGDSYFIFYSFILNYYYNYYSNYYLYHGLNSQTNYYRNYSYCLSFNFLPNPMHFFNFLNSFICWNYYYYHYYLYYDCSIYYSNFIYYGNCSYYGYCYINFNCCYSIINFNFNFNLTINLFKNWFLSTLIYHNFNDLYLICFILFTPFAIIYINNHYLKIVLNYYYYFLNCLKSHLHLKSL